jgi:hypothetical protein
MHFVIGEVNGAAKDVEDAPVDVNPSKSTQVRVHGLGIGAAEFLHRGITEIPEVPFHSRADPGDDPQRPLPGLRFRLHSSSLPSTFDPPGNGVRSGGRNALRAVSENRRAPE